MSADPLDKQLVEAVLSRPRRAKADLEEAKMAGLRPSRPKAGVAIAGGSPPACTVRTAANDFWALSRGEKNPFELLMDGKIRLQGPMEVAMALSSVLVG